MLSEHYRNEAMYMILIVTSVVYFIYNTENILSHETPFIQWHKAMS